MKYALVNTMFLFVCGELDLTKESILGPEFGYALGEEPKYYDTEAEVLEVYAHLGLMQKLVIRPYAIDQSDVLKGTHATFVIQDELIQ